MAGICWMLGLAACRPAPTAEVIAADGVLCDLTRRLASHDLRVSCLLRPGEDPHQFRLTPLQLRELSQAALVLINGYGLTPTLARLPRSVAVAELAVPQSPQLTADHPSLNPGHSHGHGHGHGDRDPHVWHDPRQAAAMVRLVSQRLQPLAPAAAARIRQRQTTMGQVLTALDQWNRAQFATIPGPPILATGHRAFASLARAYRLQELPLVDGSSSSGVLRPQALAAVVRQLHQGQVPSLLAEQRPPSRSMARISAVSGVPLAPQPLMADGLAPAEPGDEADLISTLTANTCLIAESLRGRCDHPGRRQLIARWRAIRSTPG